jgi:hypothetical protein
LVSIEGGAAMGEKQIPFEDDRKKGKCNYKCHSLLRKISERD